MNDITPPSNPWQMRVFPLFTALGWILVLLALVIGASVLAPTAVSYFGENAKATRDAAEAGSVLIGQLVTLTSTPHWLLPLTFLGVASFMVGIALEFSSIPGLLKNRGKLMAACFPLIVRAKQENK